MCAFTFVEYSARVRALSSITIVALLMSCNAPADRVAQEDLGQAEFKIVVARSGQQAEALALLIDTPYRFTLEPLKDVYARDDTLKIWVLGYTSEQLGATFPPLASRGAADIIGRLEPRLGPLTPGSYRAPEPNTILFANIDEDSPDTVLYASQDWAQAEAALGLTFAMPGTVACPPVGVRLRVYDRANPGLVCLFTRNDMCEWSRADNQVCPNQGLIFGASGIITQRPNGTLTVGNLTCPRAPAQNSGDDLGETSAYNCGSKVVVAQEEPLDAQEQPWEAVQGPSISVSDSLLNSRWVSAERGAYLAFNTAGRVELRTLSVRNDSPAYGPLQHPLVDRPQDGNPLATSTNETQISLNEGRFADMVGAASGQCFQRALQSIPSAWAPISSRSGDASIVLEAPGIPSFSDAGDWQIIGDPGANTALQPIPLRPPADIGVLGQLSTRRNAYPLDLVLHGRSRTFEYPPIDRFSEQQKLFSCARELTRPANIIGPIIASPDGYYGMARDGVQLIGPDGTIGPLLSGNGEVYSPNTWKLARTQSEAGQERVLMYRDGEAHVFNPGTSAHHVYNVPNSILAIVPGPELVYRPSNSNYMIALAKIGQGRVEGTRNYVLPAFSETSEGSLGIRAAAVYVQDNTRYLGYSRGPFAGVLDLDTGLSTGVPISKDAFVQAVFQDTSSPQIWAAVTTEEGSLTMVRFPAAPSIQ